MRILNVRFANLNSLYGEWMIDFTVGQYIHDGIFAITGPTGAGKSTILDAICLGLYGRTPRLDSIGLQSNEIMSRQRAQCFAEVTFETRSGTFCCHWGQHKARNKVDGNLVDSHHEISDALTKKVLFTKKREVAQAVEEYTGMTFDRFTRSMLLAQGQFAAFLNAEADQRSPILEQITGTEIYTRISMQVHRSNAEQKSVLANLQMVSQQQQPLDEETLGRLDGQRQLFHRWIATARRRAAACSAAITVVEGIGALRVQVRELVAERLLLETELVERSSDRCRLQRAMQAMELDTPYSGVAAKRASLEADTQEVEQNLQKLQEAQGNLAEIRIQATNAERHHEKAKAVLETTRETLKKVRALDLLIVHTSSHADEIRRSLFESIAVRRTSLREIAVTTESLHAQERQLSDLEGWIDGHTIDATLVEWQSGFQSYMQQLQENRAQVVRHGKQQNDIRQQLQQMETQIAHHGQDLQVLNKAKESLLETISAIHMQEETVLAGKVPREYETEKDHLRDKQMLMATIASLEEHRAHLENGKPCPLCGSTDHPYSTNTPPVDSGISRRLQEIDSILAQLAQLREDREQVQAQLSEQNLSIVALQTSIDSLNAQREQLVASRKLCDDAVEESEQSLHECEHSIYAEIQPYFPDPIGEEPLESLSTQLERRRKSWLEQQELRGTLVNRVEGSRQELARLHKELAKHETEVATDRLRAGKDKGKLAKELSDRWKLFGSADADEVEQRLVEDLAASENLYEAVRNRVVAATALVDTIQHSLKTLKKRISATEETLALDEPEFASLLLAQGFSNEQEFLDSRLGAQERSVLKGALDDLDVRVVRNRERSQESTRQLANLEELEPSGWTMEELRDERQESESQCSSYDQRLGAIRQTMDADAHRRRTHASHMEKIAVQQEVCTLWDRLNSLIGSHDGKRFRNFAQGLTFELLIAHANEHLRELSDRYLLTPDASKPLDIAVMDLYQAGEVRSARNLSGGESFLVSLALSLGLSTIASKKVQVDSLFLDEGFGTLDEETLETALGALASLRNQGKLVGIISHVGALQERIPVQISVTPVAGGMSRIAGPGCSRLA
ncbi:MAG: AAA family ATPase [Sphaerochaeta sp.]|nr:AAA family ATPase [Sphaerochaeta sp.]